MGMEIVAVADLEIGMFVAEPDCAWTDLPFLLQGFVLATAEEIEILRGKCRFVQIDRSRSLGEQHRARARQHDRQLHGTPFQRLPEADAPHARRRSAVFAGPAGDERLHSRRQRFLGFLQQQDGSTQARELSQELDYIEPRFDHFQGVLGDTFAQVESARAVDLRQLREGLQDMVGSLKRNADALAWLLRLRQVDQYSFDHSIDVAVYLMMLGHHIGWRSQRLVDLGLAGLLQDVGKAKLPPELLAKSQPLSDQEQALLRSHVAGSLEILFAQANLPSEVLLTVSRHHERWDGSGYPCGLGGNQIGLAAEMAGLVDSFCAMTKRTPYRDALGHQGALEELSKQRNRQFNPALLDQFVQCVGLYPVGTLVELASGEVGVVIQQNRLQRSRPRILLLLDRAKAAVPGYQVRDLRDKGCQGLSVDKSLPFGAYGLSADDYYLR